MGRVLAIFGVSDGDRNLTPGGNAEESGDLPDVNAVSSGVSGGAKSAPPGERSNASAPIATPDPVEAALADAISKAALAGDFEVVGKIVAELEARRRARLAVVDLAAERAKRGSR